MSSRIERLAKYGALAGAAIPAAAASGAVIGQQGLDIVVPAGGAVAIDFGAGFGEVFRFSAFATASAGTFSGSYTYGSVRYVSNGSYNFAFSSQVVQFNPGNAGGWTQASVLGYAPGGFNNDPRLLMASYTLGPNNTGWVSMTSGFFTNHDLAAEGFSSGYFFGASYSTAGGTLLGSFYSSGSFASTYGDWSRSARGFVGLRFSNGVDEHFAWFDVTADLDNDQMIIHGWALETTPGRGLKVPSPGAAGLGLLAMGAAGVRRHRGRAA